ncbi:hypothetical protein NPIL_390801, partial [Nephila pilipes]
IKIEMRHEIGILIMWEIPTTPTDGAAADIPRCYTIGREGDALKFASRRL